MRSDTARTLPADLADEAWQSSAPSRGPSGNPPCPRPVSRSRGYAAPVEVDERTPWSWPRPVHRLSAYIAIKDTMNSAALTYLAAHLIFAGFESMAVAAVLRRSWLYPSTSRAFQPPLAHMYELSTFIPHSPTPLASFNRRIRTSSIAPARDRWLAVPPVGSSWECSARLTPARLAETATGVWTAT